MIQYIIDTVTPLVDELIIISNNSEYKQFGHPVYEDLIKEKGPLAGIYTGLNYSKAEKNLVLSCDVPFVNTDLLKKLIENCNAVDVVIPEKENRTHQLIGVYDKSCSPSFKDELDNNQLKLKLAIEKLTYSVIDVNYIDAQIFNNINSKNDIEA